MCYAKYFRKPWLCKRSNGSYHVLSFRIADVPLTVRSGDWRTWSSKNVQAGWTGDWRVVVVSEDGSVLGSVQFAVD